MPRAFWGHSHWQGSRPRLRGEVFLALNRGTVALSPAVCTHWALSASICAFSLLYAIAPAPAAHVCLAETACRRVASGQRAPPLLSPLQAVSDQDCPAPGVLKALSYLKSSLCVPGVLSHFNWNLRLSQHSRANWKAETWVPAATASRCSASRGPACCPPEDLETDMHPETSLMCHLLPPSLIKDLWP